MSVQGTIIIDILGVGLILGIIQLVRIGRLYAGYAALWMFAATCLLVLVSIPPLLGLLTSALGAVFPVSALTLLAFVFVFLVLILFSVKLTILTERQTRLIQNLALRELAAREAREEERTRGLAYESGQDSR